MTIASPIAHIASYPAHSSSFYVLIIPRNDGVYDVHTYIRATQKHVAQPVVHVFAGVPQEKDNFARAHCMHVRCDFRVVVGRASVWHGGRGYPDVSRHYKYLYMTKVPVWCSVPRPFQPEAWPKGDTVLACSYSGSTMALQQLSTKRTHKNECKNRV